MSHRIIPMGDGKTVLVKPSFFEHSLDCYCFNEHSDINDIENSLIGTIDCSFEDKESEIKERIKRLKYYENK